MGHAKAGPFGNATQTALGRSDSVNHGQTRSNAGVAAPTHRTMSVWLMMLTMASESSYSARRCTTATGRARDLALRPAGAQLRGWRFCARAWGAVVGAERGARATRRGHDAAAGPGLAKTVDTQPRIHPFAPPRCPPPEPAQPPVRRPPSRAGPHLHTGRSAGVSRVADPVDAPLHVLSGGAAGIGTSPPEPSAPASASPSAPRRGGASRPWRTTSERGAEPCSRW